jgi:hypothetical protein
MKLVTLLVLAACCSLLNGCVDDLTADDTSAFQYLARGETAQTDDKTIQVISSQRSYDEVFYRLLNRRGSAETIDFEQYQVLLVMPGAQQYSLQQNVVAFQGLARQVQIVLSTEYAGPTCVKPAVVRQPWMLVLFPRVDKPLLITEQASVTDC